MGTSDKLQSLSSGHSATEKAFGRWKSGDGAVTAGPVLAKAIASKARSAWFDAL